MQYHASKRWLPFENSTFSAAYITILLLLYTYTPLNLDTLLNYDFYYYNEAKTKIRNGQLYGGDYLFSCNHFHSSGLIFFFFHFYLTTLPFHLGGWDQQLLSFQDRGGKLGTDSTEFGGHELFFDSGLGRSVSWTGLKMEGPILYCSYLTLPT